MLYFLNAALTSKRNFLKMLFPPKYTKALEELFFTACPNSSIILEVTLIFSFDREDFIDRLS